MEERKVEFSGVTFAYGAGEEALNIDDVCFSEGKRYLITGRCGSGKTTLAMLLKGLITPTSGTVLLRKSEETLAQFQRTIGFCFQFPEEQFFKETVEEEVAFGPTLMARGGITEAVKDSLDAVGVPFDDFAARSPFELSSGEKRRIAIASVIACNPSWYIFDEPSAGLDLKAKRVLLELFDRLANKKKTLLIITQELGLFAHLCDEIVLLDRGRLVVKAHRERFFETEGIEAIFSSFPYHIQILRTLRERGWRIPVSITDPCEAASKIVSLIE